jgi:hypothetical protein
MKQFLESL